MGRQMKKNSFDRPSSIGSTSKLSTGRSNKSKEGSTTLVLQRPTRYRKSSIIFPRWSRTRRNSVKKPRQGSSYIVNYDLQRRSTKRQYSSKEIRERQIPLQNPAKTYQFECIRSVVLPRSSSRSSLKPTKKICYTCRRIEPSKLSVKPAHTFQETFSSSASEDSTESSTYQIRKSGIQFKSDTNDFRVRIKEKTTYRLEKTKPGQAPVLIMDRSVIPVISQIIQ